MKMKKGLSLYIAVILVPALLALLFIVPFNATALAQEGKTLRIGVLVCLTGWFSTFDTLEWEEAQLARDMLNEKGGITIKGQKYAIELIAEDCKSTVDGVVAAANKLVYDHKVKFIAGPAAFFASATREVCEPEKILRAISFTTNNPEEFGKDTPYTFLCHNASVEHCIVGVKAMRKVFPNVKTVDLVNADDGAIPFLDPIFRKILQENGITVVDKIIGYPNEMVDFSPVAAKLSVSKADAVFFGNGLPEHAGKTLKGLRELGSKKPLIFMSSGLAEDVKRIAGEAASTDFIIVGPMLEAPNTPPLMAEIQKRLLAAYGKERSIHLQIFNSIWALVKVVESAQDLDTTAVRDAWEKLDTIETPYGTGHMGGLQTYGIRHAISHPEPYQILDKGQAKFGEWIEVRVP
ncbi:MAG: ABC transporter substrate-binding protein [Deltaproteobacteria bacterium]|nr:ABC transporter substrate-binding protein [Deltaproteobacteria bacterium]